MRLAESWGGIGTAESMNFVVWTMSYGPPTPEPVARSRPDGAGDQVSVFLAESAAEDEAGLAAGNPPAPSAATESTTTRTAKKQLATYKEGPEDKQSHSVGRRRSETRRTSGRAMVKVESRAVNDLTDATRRAPALLAAVKEP